jgi:hypothetical protein
MTPTKEVMHTPGPWTATNPRKWLGGTDHCKCSVRYGSLLLGNAIAEVYLGGPGALRSDVESVQANARLIAAAPELLNALRDIVVSAHNGNEPGQIMIAGGLIDSAEAAIRKALTGQA